MFARTSRRHPPWSVTVAALLRQFAHVFRVTEFEAYGIFTKRYCAKLRVIGKRIAPSRDGQSAVLRPEAGMAGDAPLVDSARKAGSAFMLYVTLDAGGSSHLLCIVQRGVVAGGALGVGDAGADASLFTVAIGAMLSEEGV